MLVNTIGQMNNTLLEKIEKKKLRLAVIGLGYVGLPTAALFAKAGFFVTALDIKEDLIQALNTGIVSINEPGLTELISLNILEGRLNPQLISDTALSGNDVFIITVQTPVDIENKPNLAYLLAAIRSIGKILRKGNAVAICSTIPPGTLKGPVKEILESLSGLRADIDFYLAYVPERIAPGKAIDEFVTGSRLVGGIGPNSTSIVAAIFKTVCKKTLETDAITAEIAKTAENTFRDVNIAFANQLALICERHGSDVVKVIDLANTHPRVNIHLSGPGVGGPCLTKDPYLLTQGLNFDNNIILTARKINDYMPYHVVNLAIDALKSSGKEISKAKISVLGTAYKANVDDPRYSPAEVVIKKLLELGVNIFAYDPYCSNTFGAVNAKSLNAAVECCDCLIIMTDHSEFRRIELQNIKLLMNSPPILIDTRRIFEPLEVEKNGFIYRGIGYSKKPEDYVDSSLTDCPRALLR